VGQDGQGCARARLLRHASQALLPGGVMAQAQRRRFGKSPCEGGLADGVARGAHACPSGRLGTGDQAAVRDDVLYPGATVAVMDVIQPHQGEARPPPGMERQREKVVASCGVALLTRARSRSVRS
jgi:hypothetical protein